MKEQKFELRFGDDYIELHKLLQIIGVAQTGGHAKILVEEGEVSVNGELEHRKRKKLVNGDQIKIDNILVSIQKP